VQSATQSCCGWFASSASPQPRMAETRMAAVRSRISHRSCGAAVPRAKLRQGARSFSLSHARRHRVFRRGRRNPRCLSVRRDVKVLRAPVQGFAPAAFSTHVAAPKPLFSSLHRSLRRAAAALRARADGVPSGPVRSMEAIACRQATLRGRVAGRAVGMRFALSSRAPVKRTFHRLTRHPQSSIAGRIGEGGPCVACRAVGRGALGQRVVGVRHACCPHVNSIRG
jgi:hypothetical protein